MDIVQIKLNELADLRSSLDTVALEKQAMIDSILTPEIKAKIAKIETEFAGKGEIATGKASVLEGEIKELVKTASQTVKGDFLMAVFAKGRVSWDPKSLDGYAVGHPEILNFRKEGDPYVSIRRI